MMNRARSKIEMPGFILCALLCTLPISTTCRVVIRAYWRFPTHVLRCFEQHFVIGGGGEKFMFDQNKMKIDDNGDLMRSSGAIPLPFIPLNKVLPGQCLSEERNEVSQVDKTRIE